MTDQLTSTGLEIDDLETRRSAVVAELRATISSILDATADQPIAQATDINLERIQALAELLQLIYSSFDPEQASGRGLDAVSSISGTYREPATNGTVTLTVDLNAATTLPAGSIAAVSGDPDNQWETTADVTSVGAGNYPVAAQCTETGPIQALNGTITVIVTPVAGWNSVTNLADAVPGENVETDAALRIRREIGVTIGGSTSVDAVRAGVNEVDGILEVYVYENYLPLAVAPMPPKSIEVVYWDGGAAAASTADIAEVIFEEKPAGIQPYGASYVAHTDSQGISHQIGMTLADEQVMEIEVTAVTDSDYVAGSIETAVATNYVPGIGDDVYRAEVIAVCMDVTGVTNVTQVRMCLFGGVLANADYSIGTREIATIDSANVTVV